jgi:hypothetical protein
LLFNPFYLYIVFGFVVFHDGLVPDRPVPPGVNAEEILQAEAAEICLTLDKYADFRL